MCSKELVMFCILVRTVLLVQLRTFTRNLTASGLATIGGNVEF